MGTREPEDTPHIVDSRPVDLHEVMQRLIEDREPEMLRLREALESEGMPPKAAHVAAATYVMTFELWNTLQALGSSPMGRSLLRKAGK